MFMAFAYVACNSENRRQRRLTFETFILAPNFTMTDVMPQQIAVPFHVWLFHFSFVFLVVSAALVKVTLR